MIQIVNKHISKENTNGALASTWFNGKLVVAWGGRGNNEINIAESTDGGATLTNKATINTEKAFHELDLLPASNKLFIVWNGAGNDINTAEVTGV